ncbi:hypothetical protein BDA96_10G258000 [Sorghum bicolor]|uniref:Uncharacterized protein n=1 Tax=Sorghum bicolor TaxID=4558 RepID=A0A921Q6P5_SORBI|nr:hypothetical protein BDA96_10G258000 [Sorghum bicolor]
MEIPRLPPFFFSGDYRIVVRLRNDGRAILAGNALDSAKAEFQNNGPRFRNAHFSSALQAAGSSCIAMGRYSTTHWKLAVGAQAQIQLVDCASARVRSETAHAPSFDGGIFPSR